MAALRTAILAFVLMWAAPAAADALARWAAPIAEASSRFGVPVEWIRRVMRAESVGRTTLNGRPIVSRAGAMGLMQLMPGTWREMRVLLGLGPDPHDPRDNILAGTAYLRMMYNRFGYPGLFAAYNAGPARYSQHLATGRRLPRETIAYVANVGGSVGPASPARHASRAPAPAPVLFAVLARHAATDADAVEIPRTSESALFVPLSADVPR